jgi:hypothetical protein
MRVRPGADACDAHSARPQKAIIVRIRHAEPDAVAITVHNVGPSIPVDEQTTIFEAFRRGASKAADWFVATTVCSKTRESIERIAPCRAGLPRGKCGRPYCVRTGSAYRSACVTLNFLS